VGRGHRPWCSEIHGPGLDHAGPRIISDGPWKAKLLLLPAGAARSPTRVLPSVAGVAATGGTRSKVGTGSALLLVRFVAGPTRAGAGAAPGVRSRGGIVAGIERVFDLFLGLLLLAELF
jgi:hypothetical protein